MTRKSNDPLLGAVLVGFVLRESLGSGGSAFVYLGVSTTTQTLKRAIKVIRKERTDTFTHRFIEEARLLSRLDHPNIVRFFHASEDQGYLVMVLELLEGQTLRVYIQGWREAGQLPPVDTVLEILVQASDGVAYAHAFEKGVVHRDIKPENLFVMRDHKTKVLDFGIARALDDAQREASTTTGFSRPGTSRYLPPELWDGKRPTFQSDVYLLGITLFEALTGRHPFEQPGEPWDTDAALMKAHLLTPIPSLRSLRADLPEALEKVIARATAKDPPARYPSATEFGRALRAVQKELAASNEPPPSPELDPSPRAEESESTKAITDFPVRTIRIEEVAEPQSPPRSPWGAHWRKGVASGVVAVGVVTAIVWPRKPVEKPHTDSMNVPSATASIAFVAPSASVGPVVMASATPQLSACPAGMVFIPKDTFKMGSDDGDVDEKPVHDETVEAFCIDKTEATVEAYAACVKTDKCKAAPTTAQWEGSSAQYVALWNQFCNANRAGREKHPINCIDWNMADAYCKANGNRLPTETEWEYAARGSDGRKYPWGNEPPDKTRLNACGPECVTMMKSKGQTAWTTPMYKEDDGFSDTAPVGQFAAGKSPYEVLDMAGNVWEWTDSPYTTNYDPKNGKQNNNLRVLRGGSWSNGSASFVRAAGRFRYAPTYRNSNFGFRCARTP